MKEAPSYSGRKLADLLAAQGRKARWLAGQAGVSESHLSRVISGERLATQATAERIAAALQVPLFLAFDFLPGKEAPAPEAAA